MSLQDRVILITGASNGIGKACAQRVAREGARVVINYMRDAASANALVEAVGADRALAVQADASTIAGVERLVDAAVAKFGRIDTVMANAGMMMMRGLEATSEDDFDSMFAMNVKGPFFLAQKALPHMPPGSQIILVSTGVCHNSAIAPDYLLYATTKGAIEHMTRVLARGLAGKGITVNAIGPGPVATELFYRGKSEAMVDGLRRLSPFGRLGEPEDIANTFAFMCSRDSAWVAGQTILVNGATMV